MLVPAETKDIPVIITTPLHNDKTDQCNTGGYMSCNS